MDILERFFVLVGIWDGMEERTVDFMLWYVDELQQLGEFVIGRKAIWKINSPTITETSPIPKDLVPVKAMSEETKAVRDMNTYYIEEAKRAVEEGLASETLVGLFRFVDRHGMIESVREQIIQQYIEEFLPELLA